MSFVVCIVICVGCLELSIKSFLVQISPLYMSLCDYAILEDKRTYQVSLKPVCNEHKLI